MLNNIVEEIKCLTQKHEIKVGQNEKFLQNCKIKALWNMHTCTSSLVYVTMKSREIFKANGQEQCRFSFAHINCNALLLLILWNINFNNATKSIRCEVLYEISHIWTAVVDEIEEWSSQLIFQFKQLERRSLKNQGFNGIRTRDLRDTGAMLYQLSYEATHWERGQLIEFISSREEWNDVKFYMK